MRITYDRAKNERNLRERGLSFERVAELDWANHLAFDDQRRDYGERRVLVLAMLDDRLHVAVITRRGDALHVISFRKANRKEVAVYVRRGH